MGMDRLYYHFPREIDFERRYGFNADARYLVKVMSSIHGKSGSIEFETEGLGIKRNVETVKARRKVTVEITDKKVDFIILNEVNLPKVLSNLQQDGTIDFRFTVNYFYLDSKYDKMSLKGDVFLVRASIDDGLKLEVAHIDGHGRTLPEEVANTIETQLKNFKG
jgi:hypothetical protein